MSAEQYGFNLLDGVREESLEQVSESGVILEIRGFRYTFPLAQ